MSPHCLQTISHIVTAMDNKFEELRALHAEDGLVRRALSSNASTAQWPQVWDAL